MKNLIGIVLSIMLITSCTPSPEAIEYGSDMCHYCKMTIVDQQHAAEVVSSKGKVFKFDAIECMLPFIAGQNLDEYSYILIDNYNQPGSLIAAESASYLISEAIPSPMGAFLSAFPSLNEANEVAELKGGTVYTWEAIRMKFTAKYSNL